MPGLRNDRPKNSRITSPQIGVLLAWGVLDLILLTGGGYYLLQNVASRDNLPIQSNPARASTSQPAPDSATPTTGIPPSTVTLQPKIVTPPQQVSTVEPVENSSPIRIPVETRAPEFNPTPTDIRLASPTPTSESIILIGHSVTGHPLEVHRFGNGPVERMIVAGIHGGNETNTILLAKKLIRYYTSHPRKIPAEITLYILPNLNPDGEARAQGIFGRANQNGVDLNHNWPVSSWQADWPRKGCWNYLYLNGGTAPASEPETQALIQFLLSRHVDALISYHSAAMGIFPGGDPPDPASQRLAQAVAAVSSYPYPPIRTACPMTGSLADWAVSQGIAALDIELTDHENTDFTQNQAIMDVFLKWRR